MDMKLEILFVPVSDVDRAKLFYQKLGFRLDIHYVANEDFRVIQFTPPNSQASIIFGKGVTSAQPGSIDPPVLAVYDIDAARDDLIARGVDVSEVFHYAGGALQQRRREPTCQPVPTRKVVPTSHLPPSRIRTGTAGCSRRSRRDFPDVSGN